MKEAEGRGATNEIHEALHAQKQHLHEAGRDQNMLLPEGWQRTEQSIGRLGLNWTFLEEYNEDSKNDNISALIEGKAQIYPLTRKRYSDFPPTVCQSVLITFLTLSGVKAIGFSMLFQIYEKNSEGLPT